MKVKVVKGAYNMLNHRNLHFVVKYISNNKVMFSNSYCCIQVVHAKVTNVWLFCGDLSAFSWLAITRTLRCKSNQFIESHKKQDKMKENISLEIAILGTSC